MYVCVKINSLLSLSIRKVIARAHVQIKSPPGEGSENEDEERWGNNNGKVMKWIYSVFFKSVLWEGGVWGGEKCSLLWTNLWNKSLISADRSNKATLLLTILCSIQVVCKGFILSNISNCASEATGKALPPPRIPPCYDSGCKQVASIYNRLTWRGLKSSRSSMDSGLEAFSRYPTHGSFAALSFQITANTNYVNERFLSY